MLEDSTSLLVQLEVPPLLTGPCEIRVLQAYHAENLTEYLGGFPLLPLGASKGTLLAQLE